MKLDLDEILERLSSNKQMLYVIGSAIGILLVVFLIYTIFFAGSSQQAVVNQQGANGPVIPSVTFIDQLKRDLGILADPVFKNLKLPIDLPIRVSPPGRDNPFTPF